MYIPLLFKGNQYAVHNDQNLQFHGILAHSQMLYTSDVYSQLSPLEGYQGLQIPGPLPVAKARICNESKTTFNFMEKTMLMTTVFDVNILSKYFVKSQLSGLQQISRVQGIKAMPTQESHLQLLLERLPLFTVQGRIPDQIGHRPIYFSHICVLTLQNA